MKTLRTVSPALIIVLLLSMLLAACGGAPPAATAPTAAPVAEPTAAPAAESTAAPAADATTTAPAPSADVVTVTWWGWNPGPAAPNAQPGDPPLLVQQFNEANPNIKVEYTNYPYADYLNALKLAMVSGEGPDIVGVQAGAMLKEYDEFLLDLAPFATETWGADYASQFYDLGLSQVTQPSGKLSGFPMMNSAAGYIWYNKTLFDQLSLQPPTTYADWQSVCEALESNGTQCFAHGAKDAWINYDMFIALAADYAPGKLYQAEAGEIAWTDPDLIAAMDAWRTLFEDRIISEGALAQAQYPDAWDAYQSGKAGMVLLGMWNDYVMNTGPYEQIKAQFGLAEDIEYLPARLPDFNGDGKAPALFGGPDVVLAVNNNSQNQQAALEFVRWALSADGGQPYLAQNLNPPAIKGLPLDDSDVRSELQKESLKQQLVDLESAAGARELLYPEIKTALADALQNVAIGSQTPEEALAAVEAASQTVQR